MLCHLGLQHCGVLAKRVTPNRCGTAVEAAGLCTQHIDSNPCLVLLLLHAFLTSATIALSHNRLPPILGTVASVTEHCFPMALTM